jgi:hypothetical protein
MTDFFEHECESNKVTDVMGLPKLLRAVASRLDNSADGLNKELLENAAVRLEFLERIATVASHIVLLVPYNKKGGQQKSKVPRETLIRLCDALNEIPEFRGRRIR